MGLGECDIGIKNAAGRTPVEIIDNEIEVFKGYVPSEETSRILARLSEIKNLFN